MDETLVGDRSESDTETVRVPQDLIVAGASAGGVEALREFVRGLPPDLDAAVAVVLHMPPHGASALPAILNRTGPLPAVAAADGMPLRSGVVYVAVPDRHLVVTSTHLHLSRGPTENGHRPGVDALFRAAAMSWAPRVACVVLSGTLDDGTAGAALVTNRGGVVAVQEPHDALYRGMPQNVLDSVAVDLVLPARDLGKAVADRLCTRHRAPDPPDASELQRLEASIDAGAVPGNDGVAAMARPSGLTCPDCNGVLYVLEDSGRYRCRVGHAWTAEALLIQQKVEVDKALWTALRALEEKQRLAERMTEDAARHGDDRLSQRYRDQGAEQAAAIETLRKLLVDRSTN
ncbi:Chemotaxis response regulator protein-glutamate methylesterase [Nocardia cerradoensis]|uniref:protein-glutamate methylesterase n=1 Tax=Nocardia cerradoensis TaxID=85688 RepID=A0A231H7F9_9NOCA|nr:chemotaxis protein CheB [Nocardia cerradoensis]OXR44864.1 Chemotaxis response regulator protein-glutamate methylesterase [Nocardia cerradoensis]